MVFSPGEILRDGKADMEALGVVAVSDARGTVACWSVSLPALSHAQVCDSMRGDDVLGTGRLFRVEKMS